MKRGLLNPSTAADFGGWQLSERFAAGFEHVALLHRSSRSAKECPSNVCQIFWYQTIEVLCLLTWEARCSVVQYGQNTFDVSYRGIWDKTPSHAHGRGCGNTCLWSWKSRWGRKSARLQVEGCEPVTNQSTNQMQFMQSRERAKCSPAAVSDSNFASVQRQADIIKFYKDNLTLNLASLLLHISVKPDGSFSI